jgi:hypothetical protein
MHETALLRALPVVIAIGVAAILAHSAQAQTAAKQGEETVTHTFTFVDKTMKLGDRTAIFRELTGLSRNDKGSGMFHNLGMRCWGFIDIIDSKASSIGRCVEADAEGDQIFSTFENKAGVGAHTLTGGTGKYAGISGQQAFSSVSIVKGPDGVSVMTIALKATWQRP